MENIEGVKLSSKSSVKRFGPKYGRKIRDKLSKIESLSKKKYECPYCSRIAVKKVSIGIWGCSKCKAKFTGKAYTPDSKGLRQT